MNAFSSTSNITCSSDRVERIKQTVMIQNLREKLIGTNAPFYGMGLKTEDVTVSSRKVRNSSTSDSNGNLVYKYKYQITQAKNYKTLLEYAKGYFMNNYPCMQPGFTKYNENLKQVGHALNSYIDFNAPPLDTELSDSLMFSSTHYHWNQCGWTKHNTKTPIQLPTHLPSDCRIKKGLIDRHGKLDPPLTQPYFQFPSPLIWNKCESESVEGGQENSDVVEPAFTKDVIGKHSITIEIVKVYNVDYVLKDFKIYFVFNNILHKPEWSTFTKKLLQNKEIHNYHKLQLMIIDVAEYVGGHVKLANGWSFVNMPSAARGRGHGGHGVGSGGGLSSMFGVGSGGGRRGH